MSAGFTPGPWSTRESRDASGDIAIVAPAGILAECFMAIRAHNEVGSSEVHSNARLIAAAPELYEALIGLLPIVFTGSPTNEQNIAHWERERDLGNGQAPAVLAAYAALAKATPLANAGVVS